MKTLSALILGSLIVNQPVFAKVDAKPQDLVSTVSFGNHLSVALESSIRPVDGGRFEYTHRVRNSGDEAARISIAYNRKLRLSPFGAAMQTKFLAHPYFTVPAGQVLTIVYTSDSRPVVVSPLVRVTTLSPEAPLGQRIQNYFSPNAYAVGFSGAFYAPKDSGGEVTVLLSETTPL